MTTNQYNYYKELNTHKPVVVLYKLVSKQRKGADCGNSETGFSSQCLGKFIFSCHLQLVMMQMILQIPWTSLV